MLEDEIRCKVRELSIPLIGFSEPEKTDYAKIVRERIERGFITKEMMKRTECFRTPEAYADPKSSLPDAKTLVCIGGAYLEKREQPSDMSRRAWIARHFWRDSYTDLERKRDSLIEFLRSKGFKAEIAKMHPRETARMTGIAWIGRNNFAINPTYGSWTLYYPLVTDARIEPTPRIQKSCPTNCRKCMDACPTKAIVEPFVLDPRRCINYMLEEDTPAPGYARHLIGNRINGCDTCQEACPMNKKVELAPQPLTARAFDPGFVPFPTLERCFEVTDHEMEQNYAHMDWYEPKVRYLRRNALIAVGNSNERDLIHLAKKYKNSEDPVLKDHALWAIDRLS
jgi:epoxyqueuosine reductase